MQDPEQFPTAAAWGAKTIAAIQFDCRKQDKGQALIRYFICSPLLSAEEMLGVTRKHWRVENQLHWFLNVFFDEDRSRARKDNAAEKLVITRQVTHNLLKMETTVKAGIKNKRKHCGWDEGYMVRVLGLFIE